jgi:hypothetical protein
LFQDNDPAIIWHPRAARGAVHTINSRPRPLLLCKCEFEAEENGWTFKIRRTPLFGPCHFLQMADVKRLTTARSWRRLVARSLGCLLVLQAVMAGIGLGMSASASEQTAFEICTSASSHHPGGNQQKSDHRPQCPFCLAATQCGRHYLSAPSVATAHSSNVEARVVGVFRVVCNDEISGFCSRRTSGDPRGPPEFSI